MSELFELLEKRKQIRTAQLQSAQEKIRLANELREVEQKLSAIHKKE